MAPLSEILRQLRLDKHLSQAQVANKMNISQALYSMIETGKRPELLKDGIRVVNGMRLRSDRTLGGIMRVGRHLKG